MLSDRLAGVKTIRDLQGIRIAIKIRIDELIGGGKNIWHSLSSDHTRRLSEHAYAQNSLQDLY